MSDGIYVALSGALAQNTLLETTANNLANASTDGYQRVRPVFQEMVTQAANGAVAPRRTSAVTVSTTARDQSAGAMRPTGRALDAALPQGVYLSVDTARGERFTRAVSLTTGPDNTLRTVHGQAVMGEGGGPITVPPNGAGDLTLTADGEVRRGTTVLGRLKLVTFDQPERMQAEGATLLSPNGANATPATNQMLTLGMVEESNATTISAMTDMVTATRTFEAFQRVIDAFREADHRVVSTVPGSNG